MRWPVPVAAMTLGVILLKVGMQAGDIASWLVDQRMIGSTQRGMAQVTINLGSVGVAVLLLGLGIVLLWRWGAATPVSAEPWRETLAPLAYEYGRKIEESPSEGLGFASQVDGARTEVVVQPRRGGHVSVWVAAPGRQMLMFLPRAREGALADDPLWRLAGQRGTWVLRAELPGLARPLLEEHALTEAVDNAMNMTWLQAIRHDQKGIEVLMDLMAPEELPQAVRRALAVCRALRAVNG